MAACMQKSLMKIDAQLTFAEWRAVQALQLCTAQDAQAFAE